MQYFVKLNGSERDPRHEERLPGAEAPPRHPVLAALPHESTGAAPDTGGRAAELDMPREPLGTRRWRRDPARGQAR